MQPKDGPQLAYPDGHVTVMVSAPHVPFTQLAGWPAVARQAFPQVPQLLTSLLVSTQAALPPSEVQYDCPAGQHLPLVQLPLVHPALPLHCWPLMPLPPVHDPFEQVVPDPQTVPQFPQLLESVLVLTHAPLQRDWPVGQVGVHFPLTQATDAEPPIEPDVAQTLLQPPQLSTSLLMFVSQPVLPVPQ